MIFDRTIEQLVFARKTYRNMHMQYTCVTRHLKK